ncbi:NAD(P)H-binding protein [Nitrospira lenta]|uniref:NAD(P)-binding domain-containing protein n=1 Tax=Nitrospira lenta TaxID=1436998 RepID=A0A330L3Z1_9BACT|nr:NAD(P)H-binding protein [Nitrospira lenta]SPP64528.1 hypothetical protein NITLEN_20168 [Nitrospira lenta]
MFVVLGATGNTGSTVADTLLHRKQPVRVVVRSADKGAAWKAKGAEVAVASLEDVPAMTKALMGATGVYLLVPPNYGAAAWLAEQRQRMDQAAQAVKASGIPHVVFLSSVGGHLADGTGPIRAVHYGEQVLGAVANHLTILRPCSFMENWAPGIGMAKIQGLLPTFMSFGFSQEAATLFKEMYTGFATGTIGYERPEQSIRGIVTLTDALRRMV